MLFSEERLERYVMQAEAMSQGAAAEQARWFVDVDVVGAALGMTSHESRYLAFHLERQGWVEIHHLPLNDSPKLRMTLDGLRAIARLRQPPWRRWLDRHPGIAGAVAGALTGVAAALATRFLERLVWG